MPDGGTSTTVMLTPIANTTAQAVQTAILTLVSASSYTLGSTTGATVSLYDTNAPVFSISPATVTKAGSTSTQTLTFTVAISGSSLTATGVTVATVAGTALGGKDYTALTTLLTFTAGSIASQTVTVTLLGRATGNVNHAFTVQLSAPTGGATISSTANTSTVTITGTSAQVASTVAPAGSDPTPLTTAALQPVIAAAERAWEAAGVSAWRFAHVRFVITTQLPVGEIGYTAGSTVYIDATGAGFGWYTGRGPGAFGASGIALAGGPAAGRMDLLTVVMHELGHILGLPDGCACGAATTLMQATLPAGQRRGLPAVKAHPPRAMPAVRAHRAGRVRRGAHARHLHKS
jgi:hypothetical protein